MPQIEDLSRHRSTKEAALQDPEVRSKAPKPRHFDLMVTTAMVLTPLAALGQSSLDPGLVVPMSAQEAILPAPLPVLPRDIQFRSNLRPVVVPDQPAPFFARFETDDFQSYQQPAPTCQMACNAEPRCRSYWIAYNSLERATRTTPSMCHLSEGPNPYAGTGNRASGVRQDTVVPTPRTLAPEPPFRARLEARNTGSYQYCFEDGRCVTRRDNAGSLRERHHQLDGSAHNHWIGELQSDGGRAVTARGTGELLPLSADAYAERRAGSEQWEIKRFDGARVRLPAPCRSIRSDVWERRAFAPRYDVRSGAICFENRPDGSTFDSLSVSGAFTPIDGAGIPGHTYRDARLILNYGDYRAIFHRDGSATLTDQSFLPLGDRLPLAVFLPHTSVVLRAMSARQDGRMYSAPTLALALEQRDPWGRQLWQVLPTRRGIAAPEGFVGAIPLVVYEGICGAKMMAVACQANLIGWALEWHSGAERWQTLAGIDGQPVSRERYDVVFLRTGRLDRMAIGRRPDGSWDAWRDDVDTTTSAHLWSPMMRSVPALNRVLAAIDNNDSQILAAARNQMAREAARAAQERQARADAHARAQAETAARNAQTVAAAMTSGNRDQICSVAQLTVQRDDRERAVRACSEIQAFQDRMAAERSAGTDWYALGRSLSQSSRPLTGAPPLSALEEDYYIGRGYVRVQRPGPTGF